MTQQRLHTETEAVTNRLPHTTGGSYIDDTVAMRQTDDETTISAVKSPMHSCRSSASTSGPTLAAAEPSPPTITQLNLKTEIV